MASTVENLIAVINPEKYSVLPEDKMEAKKKIEEIKSQVKEKGLVIAAQKAKPKTLSEHKLVYECYTETLEPIYYWILDFLNDSGMEVQKIIDNFSSSPGSSHWQDVGQRKGIVQQQASRAMQDIFVVLRGITSIIYDLKDFEIRFSEYNALDSKDLAEAKAARLTLKQRWMDKVDIQKGNSSIKGLALSQQADFVTLLDAFLAAETKENVKDLDLNERVKRIVMSRLYEFETWIDKSKEELTRRYNIQKNYLKSQVNTLKLYSRWVKPYLIAASDLESQDVSKQASLVKAFNRTLIEIILLGKSKVKSAKYLKSAKGADDVRDYFACTLVSFSFLAVPGQGNFVGKATVTFKSYALNSDEMAKLNKSLEESDIYDVAKLIQGATDDSLKVLQEDLDKYLGDKEEKKETKKEEKTDYGKNPFSALFGVYNNSDNSGKSENSSIWEFLGLKKKKEEWSPDKDIRSENWVEENYIRPEAEKSAKDRTFNVFNIYKKAHGMATYI